MTTISQLAREYGMPAYGLRAFADDLLDGVADDETEIPPTVERVLRLTLPLEQQTPEEIRDSEYGPIDKTAILSKRIDSLLDSGATGN